MFRFLLFAVPILFVPDSVQSETLQESRPRVLQLALDSSGTFAFSLVNETGKPLANAAIMARSRSETVQLLTNESGSLKTTRLSPGTWVFTVGDRAVVCRIWKEQMAPPGALQQLVLVQPSSAVIRGNNRSCEQCKPVRMNRTNRKYGVAILALGGTAAYFAISRDNAS